MTRSRGRQPAAGLLGGGVQPRPRLPAAPVRALIARVERSAARATAIAETLDDAPAQQADMRAVAVALAGHAATLRRVLAEMTDDPEPEEADG